MNIKNVELNNFTAFVDCKIDFANGVNIFIGENSIGKTCLLKLLIL